jgi:hypothetical protein
MWVIISVAASPSLAQFPRSRDFLKCPMRSSPICQAFVHLYFWFGDPNRNTGF